jgi:hypothetical protein
VADILSILAEQAPHHRRARRYTLNEARSASEVAGKAGIYILEFENGEAYVGKAVNAARRLSQHVAGTTHSDFSSFCFVQIARDGLSTSERETMAVCERAGIRLRNFAGASFNYKPSALDELVEPEFLDSFTSGAPNDFSGERPDEADLRRRYVARFSELQSHRNFQDVVSALRLYVSKCIPAPRRTELGYWSVSCLPSRGSGRLLACVSIHWQEVLLIGEDEQGPWAGLNLAGTPLVDAGEFTPDEVQSRYVPGGADQASLTFHLNELAEVLEEPAALQAARMLNVRLMRKGKCNFGRSHCLELADQILDASVTR